MITLRAITLRSTRDAYGEFLAETGKNKDVVVLDADLSESTRTSKFKEKFPDRFVNVGCAEQNLVGIAAGLAYCGKIVFASTYSIFGTARAWEQIRLVAHDHLNVKFVFSHAGLSNAPDGASHHSLEDIATMRVIPGMNVVIPCDAEETKEALYALLGDKGTSYVRLRREKEPILEKNYEFELGKAPVMIEGNDVTVIAAGMMVAKAVEASEELRTNGISARVINMHTIKPLDKKAIVKAARETSGIITVENHSIIGGLGGAVAEIVSEKRPTPVKRIGVWDKFGQSARSVDELLEHYGLTSRHIVQVAKNIVNSSN